MPSFYTILTDVGQAKLANAIALGQTIEITDLAVGDGNGALPTPETSRTALVNEVRRAPINLSEVDDQNPNWVVVEQVLPPDVGGWTIREIGVFDIDGDLIGYGNYPETYKPVLAEGSSRTQTIRFVMEVSDTQAITLKVDPSVVLATRGYADNLMDDHEASRNHPSATTGALGMIELATTSETNEGTDQSRAVTPAGLTARTATETRSGLSEVATQVETNDGVDDWRIVTPKKLKNWVRDATTTTKGMVEKATENEAKSGSADKYPDAAGVLSAIHQYGLGSGAGTTTNIDTIVKTGFYIVTSTTSGIKPNGSGSAGTLIHVERGSSNIAFQIFSLFLGAGAKSTVYIRTKNADGIWNSWSEIQHGENERQVGVLQSWQDLTSSRSAGVTYTNSTGKPIQISIVIQSSASSNSFEFSVGSVTVASASASSSVMAFCLNQIVPSGETYALTLSGSMNISSWCELR